MMYAGYVLLALMLAQQPQKVGHYEWQKATEWIPAHSQWIPPEDCTSWPKGMMWAGGIVYDIRGCAYPKIDGNCFSGDDEKVPNPCFEHPPLDLLFRQPSQPEDRQ